MIRRTSLLVALMLTASCRPSVPAELRYRLRFSPEETLPGLAFEREGVKVGEMNAAGLVDFTTPSTVRASALRVTASLPSPCGVVHAPVVLQTFPHLEQDKEVAESMKRDGMILISAKLPATRRFKVILNRGEGALQIGEAVVPAKVSQFSLFDKEGCAASAPVTVDGKTIGTWRAGRAATFISVPATCHQLSKVTYGDAVGGSSIVIHQQVRGLESEPDFFLKKAPTSVNAKGGSARYLTELLPIDCPAGPPPAEVARQAFEHGDCLEAVPSLKRAVNWNDEDLESSALLVMCLAKSYSVSEATEVAKKALLAMPDSLAKLQESFVTAGHPEVTLKD